MLRALKWPLCLTALIALAACDPTLPSVARVPGVLRKDAGPPKTEVTVDKTLDQVWIDLAIVAASNSFSIHELDHGAGFLRLGFGNKSFVSCQSRVDYPLDVRSLDAYIEGIGGFEDG